MQKPVDYTAAIRTKYPEQVVIAIAKDAKGKPNPITLGWTMITSGSPPMMAVSIGETRYSLEALRHSGEFVVAFPAEDAAEEAMFYGTKSGREVQTGDHFLFVGEVVASHLNTEPRGRLYTLASGYRMGGVSAKD